MTRPAVYILHITDTDGTVTHYVGLIETRDISIRLNEHRTGKGSILTAAAHRRGAHLELGRIIHGADYRLETALINTPNIERFCLICSAMNTDREPNHDV